MPVLNGPFSYQLSIEWSILNRTVGCRESPALFPLANSIRRSPSSRSLRRRLVVPLAILLSLLSWQAVADQPITARLRDGRKLQGMLDAQTSESQLWLEFRGPGAIVRRGLAWDRLLAVETVKGPVSRQELLALAVNLRPQSSRTRGAGADEGGDVDRAGGHERPRQLVVPTRSQPGTVPNEDAANRKNAPPPRRVPTDLELVARLGNWNSGPETDGLLLQVIPFDREYQPVATRGTLSVELWAAYRIDQDAAPHGRGRELKLLGRWNQAYTADGDGAAAWSRFPFGTVHPELDPRCAPYGLVRVELVVPGVGVFRRELDGVRIRPWSPTADLGLGTTAP